MSRKNGLLFCVSLFALSVLGPASAGATPAGTAAVHWVASDFFDSSARDWRLGMGFDLSAAMELSRSIDLRGDWGVRWADGERRVIGRADEAPGWGGRPQEKTESLRTMPFTADLVYRWEHGCCGRYVPFLAGGIGLYDMTAGFFTPSATPRHVSLFKFGWNARAGLQIHTPSGTFVNLETALHVVQLPEEWAPAYDVAFGIGTVFPRP